MRFELRMGVLLLAGMCVLVLGTGRAFGAGFGIYEWSARGNALGGDPCGSGGRRLGSGL